MSSVKVFKMNNGEEVVSSAVEKLDGSFQLSSPRVFHVMPTPDGKVQAALMPYFMSNPDAEFTIRAESFVAQIPATAEMEDQYNRQTSKLVIPSKSLI